MTKTVVEILKEARELISVPERWCRYALARDVDGTPTATNSDYACRWCSIGALYNVEPSLCLLLGKGEDPIAVLDEAAQELLHQNIVTINDNTDHSTVLKAFDLAISKAEAGQ